MKDQQVSCYIDSEQVNCTTWEKEPMLTQELKERQQLCKDIEYLIAEDKAIREEIIDEYVYLLSDKRVEEMQEYCRKELEADF